MKNEKKIMSRAIKKLEEYKVMFPNIGTGYLTTSPIKGLVKTPTTLAGETLIVGKKTTLQGYFLKPTEYVGFIQQQNSIELFFLLGTENSIFETKYYYENLFKINELRTFKMFSNSAGRDFNFIEQKWH